jgi:hypothetical protein
VHHLEMKWIVAKTAAIPMQRPPKARVGQASPLRNLPKDSPAGAPPFVTHANEMDPARRYISDKGSVLARGIVKTLVGNFMSAPLVRSRTGEQILAFHFGLSVACIPEERHTNPIRHPSK